MWRFCCVISRKDPKIIESKQQHSKSEVQPLTIITEPPSIGASQVDLHSWRSSRNKANGHTTVNSFFANCLSEHYRRHSTPYFEIDLETGRRPTLVVETTARLALAESVGIDDLGTSRRSSSASAPICKYWSRLPFSTAMSTQRKLTLTDSSSPKQVPCPNATKQSDIRSSTSQELVPQSSVKKRTGFIKLRAPDSFRKRLMSKKNERFSKLNLLSRSSKKGGVLLDERFKSDESELTPLASVGEGEDVVTRLPAFQQHHITTVAVGCGSTVVSPGTSKVSLNSKMSGSGNSRRDSLYIFSHSDEPIVTPFAQILASLRKVRSNFIYLTNVHSSKDLRFGTSHESEHQNRAPYQDDAQISLAMETLEELEWCLERLENVQTHRSVSDMASSKFKKLLNKELNQVYDGDRISSQISDYICSTFLDQDESEQGGEGGGGGGGGISDVYGGNVLRDVETVESEDPQHTITAHDLQLRKTSTSAPDSETPTPVIIRIEKSDDEADAGKIVKLRPGENNSFLGARTASVSYGLMPSILGVKGSVTGVGVDPNKVIHLEKLKDSTEMPPTYGIVPEFPEELSEMLENDLDQWGMDIFKLAEYTISPLTCVTYTILKRRGLINIFKIPHWNLIRYLRSVELHYNSLTPYHNKIHAADVVQSVHVLLQAPALDSVFTDAELAAVIIACAVHDVNHPGVTNQYLINTNDALAILYNDSSVLENYHLAVAFNLLTYPGCDILVNLSRKQRLSFRRMIIDMVLSTDMSKHMSLLADLKTMVETKKVAGSRILNLDNYTDRIQILQNMVHCADLSNTAKPLELYTRWMHRLMDEFFLQGDRERAAGLDISPMCDRETATIEKSQVSFIDFISHPLWETWSDLVHPAAQCILELLEYNRNWYFNLIHSEEKTADSQSSSMRK